MSVSLRLTGFLAACFRSVRWSFRVQKTILELPSCSFLLKNNQTNIRCSRSSSAEVWRSQTDLKILYLHSFISWSLHCSLWAQCWIWSRCFWRNKHPEVQENTVCFFYTFWFKNWIYVHSRVSTSAGQRSLISSLFLWIMSFQINLGSWGFGRLGL